MDEQLYLMAMGFSLDEKLEKSLAQLRHYEAAALKADPENGYYVCDSYGKDSCVIRHLCRVAGVKHKCHHHLTTIDPPELIRFGRENHPDTIINRPRQPMLVRLTERSNGPPTRLARWCCAEYKEGVKGGNRKVEESQNSCVKVFGVRAAESTRRKAHWKVWQPNLNNDKGWILNPILYWSDEDVWRYIRREGIPYCCLYDEGWERLGCVGCPMAGNGRRKEFDRWPGYERAWKRAFERFWNRWHGVPRESSTWSACPSTWTTADLWHGEYFEDRAFQRSSGTIGNLDITIGKVVRGVVHRRRWFDAKGLQSWEELWQWWMEELPEAEDEGCQMGLF